MKTLLKKLIKFKTDQNHPQEINKCFAFVVDYLKKNGLQVKSFSSNNKPSLIASKKIKKHYKFILNGHLDVVPADYKNAFMPQIKDSRLYGRGSADMKGVIVAMIKLMADKDLNKIDAALMLTTDEEVGGTNGVRYLLQKKGFNCDCAIIPDGGNNFELVLAEKGILHLKLTAKGKTVHGSCPWKGENALEKLIRIYQFIKSRMPIITSKNTWLPSLNLGKITGGDAVNKVPNHAEMLLDFRFTKNTQLKKMLNWLEAILAKETKVKYEILSSGSVLNTAEKNIYINRFLDTAKKLKINMKLKKCNGASDARYFAEKNIPVIITNPKSSPAHIDNEWIDLKSLNKFYALLKKFLLNN